MIHLLCLPTCFQTLDIQQIFNTQCSNPNGQIHTNYKTIGYLRHIRYYIVKG